MRAVVLEQVRAPFAVADLELLPLEPRQVRVKTGASGVCHSDRNLQLGYYWPTGPIVAGHEGAGTVVEAGPEVTLVRPGDRVILAREDQHWDGGMHRRAEIGGQMGSRPQRASAFLFDDAKISQRRAGGSFGLTRCVDPRYVFSAFV